MNKEYIEHIALYKDVYPEGYCQHLISEFERLENGGVGANRQRAENIDKHIKDDYQIFINLRGHNPLPFQDKNSRGFRKALCSPGLSPFPRPAASGI